MSEDDFRCFVPARPRKGRWVNWHKAKRVQNRKPYLWWARKKFPSQGSRKGLWKPYAKMIKNKNRTPHKPWRLQ